MSTLKEDINRAIIAIHRETWKEWIPLKEIYAKVEKIRKVPNPNKGAPIRASLEKHCKLSDAFSGKELYILKEKGLGLYKSYYFDKLVKINQLEIGDILTFKEITELFNISGRSGIMKTNSLDALVLTTSESNGIYQDSEIIEGKITYTGEGQDGDQQLIKNNKTLYHSLENNLYVFLFSKEKNGTYTFEGRVCLNDEPYQMLEKDSKGKERKVWKFPLKIIYSEKKFEKDNPNFSELVKEVIEIERKVVVSNSYDKLIIKNGPPKIRKHREKSERAKNNRTKKPDYIAEEIVKCTLGIVNEKRIYDEELKLLMNQNAKLEVEKMKEFYKNKKDNEGFDILSFELNEQGNYVEKYIEVKSTKGNESTPIDITDNEIDFAKKHKDQYYLYRIVKSEDVNNRYIKILKGEELFKLYKLVPNNYKIYSK